MVTTFTLTLMPEVTGQDRCIVTLEMLQNCNNFITIFFYTQTHTQFSLYIIRDTITVNDLKYGQVINIMFCGDDCDCSVSAVLLQVKKQKKKRFDHIFAGALKILPHNKV